MTSRQPAQANQGAKSQPASVEAASQSSVLFEATKQAAQIIRSPLGPQLATRNQLLQLQRVAGNRAVNRYLAGCRRSEAAIQRQPQPAPTEDSPEVSTSLEARIERARGKGAALESPVQDSMQRILGVDLDGVKIHTDSESHSLNRSVQAKAFTTGKDIFFREGEYRPDQPEGKRLIAHELTHVVQQQQGRLRRTIQRTQWTWDGKNWTTDDTNANEKLKPTETNHPIGTKYDDQNQQYSAPSEKSEPPKPPPSSQSSLPRETTSKSKSKGFGLNLGLGLSLNTSLQSVDDYLNSQNINNYAELGGQVSFSQNLLLLQNLAIDCQKALVDAEDWWLHGSTSASLAFLTRTGHKLLTTTQLLELGLAPFSGEGGNAYHPKSVNTKGVSGVHGMRNMPGVLKYTNPEGEGISDQKPINLSPEEHVHQIKSALEELKPESDSNQVLEKINKLKAAVARQYLTMSKEPKVTADFLNSTMQGIINLKLTQPQSQLVSGILEYLGKVLNQKPLTDEEKTLLSQKYPVAYGGFKIPLGQLTAVPGGAVSGEHIFQSPELGKTVQYVFVPQAQVEAVTKMLQAANVTVAPFEVLTLIQTLMAKLPLKKPSEIIASLLRHKPKL